jgi:uncharacterized membrane protein
LWEDDTSKTEFIYDCDSLKLAAKVGVIGIILLIVEGFMYTAAIMYYTEMPGDAQFYILLNDIFAFNFISLILAGVGFVGVFSMKQSKLGIFFPLIVIISRCVVNLYLRISFELGIYSSELHPFIVTILGYTSTIIGGLLILSLRRKSENSQFVSIFAVIYLLQNVLNYVVWQIIFGGPVQINSGFDYLIASLPTLATGIAVSVLTMIFFVLESRQGCIGESGIEETPFLE